MLGKIFPLLSWIAPQMTHNLLTAQMNKALPFNTHVGLKIDEIGPGTASGSLAFRKELTNHIGTLHASALFALAEAVSGAAMTGAFGAVILNVRPLASDVSISYAKVAKISVVAKGKMDRDPDELMTTLKSEGKVRFNVKVVVDDTEGARIAEATVAWHVAQRK